MPQADVMQLVDDLSNGQANPTAALNFYNNILQEMSLELEPPWFLNMTFIHVVAGTGDYDIQLAQAGLDSAILPWMVFYDGNELPRTTIAELTMTDPDWHTRKGVPKVWVTQEESAHVLTLVPVPQMTGATLPPQSPTAILPPEGNLMVVYTEDRTQTAPSDPHLEDELMIALEICAREFARDSDHTDHTLAQSFRQLSQAVKSLLVEIRSRRP